MQFARQQTSAMQLAAVSELPQVALHLCFLNGEEIAHICLLDQQV